MPCNSDYMEPTSLEYELQRTARLLVKHGPKLGVDVTKSMRKAAKDIYCSEDFVSTLCSALRNMGKKKRDELLYSDAKDVEMRKLATWWERHEEADRKRKAQEKKQAQLAEITEHAVSKLTPFERKVLGL